MILSRWFKLDKGVQKSREGVFARIASVFEQPRPIDDDKGEPLERAKDTVVAKEGLASGDMERDRLQRERQAGK